MERDLKTLGDKPFPNVFHRFGAAVERVGNLRVGPSRSLRIRFEQHPRSTHFLRRTLELVDHLLERFPFLVREANNVLLEHGTALLG